MLGHAASLPENSKRLFELLDPQYDPGLLFREVFAIDPSKDDCGAPDMVTAELPTAPTQGKQLSSCSKSFVFSYVERNSRHGSGQA
jgi:hypothetical protein